MCVLLKVTLLYCRFISIELTTNNPITPAWKLIQRVYFFHKALSQPIAFRNTRQHLSTMLRAHFKRQNYQENCKECGTKYTAEKNPLVYSMRAETRQPSISLFTDLSWEWTSPIIQNFTTLARLGMTAKAPQVLIWSFLFQISFIK